MDSLADDHKSKKGNYSTQEILYTTYALLEYVLLRVISIMLIELTVPLKENQELKHSALSLILMFTK